MKNYLTEVLVILADAGVEFGVGGGVGCVLQKTGMAVRSGSAVAASPRESQSNDNYRQQGEK